MAEKTTKRTTTTKNTAAASDAAPAKSNTRSAPRKAAKILPTEEQVRQRAFEIFLNRNGADGDAHGDWIRAERELVAELNS
jgi:hypothetical protein